MRRVCTFALAIACAVQTAEGALKRERLSREETIELFKRLHDAAAKAKTFRAGLRRTEETGLLLDAEPRVYEGRVVAGRRPDRGREEILGPRRSVKVATEREAWVYFPEERKAEHVDLAKGIKGREETTSGRSFMAWLAFDFEELNRRFEIAAERVPVPEGLVVKKVPPVEESTEADAGGGAEGTAEDAPAAEPVPLACPYLHEITFVPRKPEYAPDMLQLVLTVYDEEPWPVRIEQESEDGLIVSEYRDIVLDVPVGEGVFRFKPPRGTKVVELSR